MKKLDQLAKKLDELIEEGIEVHKKCYKSLYGGNKDYIYGEEYNTWMQKCNIFLNKFCLDKDIVEVSKKIVEKKDSSSLGAYMDMMGMLRAIKGSDDILNCDIDNKKRNRKIFISHSSRNTVITDKFVNMLKKIGVKDNQMYYSSFVETGAKYLDDCFESISKEFKENELMVIFMLSRAFYTSDVCIAEMGAAWVSTENYIPIVLPPLGYDDIKGVIKSTQNGILLTANDISQKLDTLKETIQQYLEIENSISAPEWTREKEEFIKKISEVKYKDIDIKINDLKIHEDTLTLKLLIENNTKFRYECEGIYVNLKVNGNNNIVKSIDDWSIKSIVIQRLESITFFINIKLDEQVKRSSIIIEESQVELECYQSN